jgi:hypothetical protein
MAGTLLRSSSYLWYEDDVSTISTPAHSKTHMLQRPDGNLTPPPPHYTQSQPPQGHAKAVDCIQLARQASRVFEWAPGCAPPQIGSPSEDDSSMVPTQAHRKRHPPNATKGTSGLTATPHHCHHWGKAYLLATYSWPAWPPVFLSGHLAVFCLTPSWRAGNTQPVPNNAHRETC